MPRRPPVHGREAGPRPRPPDRRVSAARRGYDAAWRRFRLWWLARYPLCGQMLGDRVADDSCLARGWIVEATEVDHIVPLSRGGARLDPANARSSCKSCHSRKTVEEDGGFGEG